MFRATTIASHTCGNDGRLLKHGPMVTLIADSNALRHPGLEKYLKASRDHTIGLSDLTLMEMRKRNALSTSRASLEIATRYVDQVYLLKITSDLLDHDVRAQKDLPALFDYQETLQFRQLCADLRKFPPPDHLAPYMVEQERVAQEFLSRLLVQVKDWEPALREASKAFTREELRAIAKKQAPDISRKITDLLKETVRDFMRSNGLVAPGLTVTISDLLGTLAFRYSLCVMVFYLLWVQTGRSSKRLDRRLNDVIDLQIAATGSYFDGVLSADDLVKDVSAIAREVLRSYGAYVPVDWHPPDAMQAAFRGENGAA